MFYDRREGQAMCVVTWYIFFHSLDSHSSFRVSVICTLTSPSSSLSIGQPHNHHQFNSKIVNTRCGHRCMLSLKSPKVERNSLQLVLCRPPHLFASALHDCRGSNLKQRNILNSPITVNWLKTKECAGKKEKEKMRNIDCVCDALMLLVYNLVAMRCASIKWA